MGKEAGSGADRTASVRLPFQIGARTLGHALLRLVRRSVPLEQAVALTPPDLPELPGDADGYLIGALPEAARPLIAADKTLHAFVRQAYVRYYARLDQPFESWFGAMSGNGRSALRRKRRKLEQRCGGRLDIRLYRHPGEVDEFHRHARAVSALSYQERLLDAGLPANALNEARELAARDALRAWLLFIDDKPASYLYMPAEGRTLLYRHLGYDPAFADLSPGGVLQLEAMRMLMEEKRFRWLDFTEGGGQHKRQFATDGIASIDLMLLRPALSSLSAAYALQGFDRSVANGKQAMSMLGLDAAIRALRR